MKALLVALPLLVACQSAHEPPNVRDAEAVVSLKPPAADTFVLGPGDVIHITVWRHNDLSMQVTIAPDGSITFPLLGRLEVGGASYTELVKIFEDGLAEYFTDPAVAVNVVEVTNQKVFVLGEVRSPAVLQVQSDLSILEALTRTGGINPDAQTDNVLLIRGGMDEPELYTIDVDSIYGQGDFSQLIYLQRGDIVLVPPKTIVNAERFFRRVQGMLAPFVAGSVIYRNAISGGAQGASGSLD